MKKIAIITLLSQVIWRLNAQDFEDKILYSPPSPNSMNLAKYATIPVSLYTGTPIISFPITELKGRNLSVPVSISYHASGIKVQEVSSWVGLGWSLNAGGVITRTVRGLPDEDANGFCGTNNIGEKAYLTPDVSYVSNVSYGSWDGEPDLFSYNFLGNTGTFILDESGVPVLLPHSNLKIQPGICPANTGNWSITDANGVIYKFGTSTNSIESSTSQLTGGTARNYVSSWYLTEIASPDGEVVQFSYVSGEQVSYKYYIQSERKKIRYWGFQNGCSTDPTTLTDKNVEITISSPRYLDEITSTQGKIKFKTLSNRSDLPGGRSLKQIELYSTGDVFVKAYKFLTSYFQSDGCSTPLCLRLRLDGLYEVANGVGSKRYSFSYNQTNLPSRDSHQIDHWGFYNNNQATTKIPALDDTESPCAAFHSGADRTADSLKSRANILTRVYVATGGFTEFVYSANIYSDASDIQNVAGGVRILRVNNCSAENNCNTQYFYYNKASDISKSSGTLYKIPRYHFRSFEGSWVSQGGSFASVGSEYLIRQSQSLADAFDLNGYHVGYGSVKTKELNNGYVWNYFTNLQSNPDLMPTQNAYKIPSGQSSGQITGSIPSDGFPYTPSTSKFWERGILYKREIYSQSGKLLTRETTKVKLDLASFRTVPAFKSGKRAYDYFGVYYYLGSYQNVSRPYVLEKTTATTYDQNSAVSDTVARVRMITEYAFNSTTLMPTQVSSYNEQTPTDKVVTTTSYVTDYSYTGGWQDCDAVYNSCMATCQGTNCSTNCQLQKNNCLTLNSITPSADVQAMLFMSQSHQLAAPVEVKQSIQKGAETNLIGATVYTYQKTGSSNVFARPKGVWKVRSIVNQGGGSPYLSANINSGNGTFEKDSRLKLVSSLDSYDPATGNLLQQTDFSGVVTQYSWSTNYQRSLLTGITINPGASEQSSAFEFKQLVGVTKQTDVNSRDVRYEYDQLNRLEVTRDHAQNVLTRVKGRTINEGYEARIGISGTTVINGQVTLEDVFGSPFPGNSSYNWTFGDGGTASGVTSVNHSYTSAGTYTVTLTKSNADYGSASASTSVTIAPGPSVSICADGPVDADLCGVDAATYGQCTSPGNLHYYSNTYLNATVSNGCGNNTYSWQYDSGSGWTSFGGNSALVQAPILGTPATYNVRCTVVDGCSNTSAPSVSLQLRFYKKTSNCNQQ